MPSLTRFLLFTIALSLCVPLGVLSWGRLSEIGYKIKKNDGNRWEKLLGTGDLVRGDECPGTLTFTFDDGPDHRTTPVILDQLDRYGVKGSFFINGTRIHKRTAGGIENQAVLRDIYRRGHYIGNHTYSHKDITLLDEQGWEVEVSQVEWVVRALINRRPRLFRPPFGTLNLETIRRLTKQGYSVVMWNIDPLDWSASTPLDLFNRFKRVIEENPKGGVVLLHDTNRVTAETLPLMIEWIQERNATLAADGKTGLEIVGIEHYIKGLCN